MQDNSSNAKNIYGIANKLLHRKVDTPLPQHSSLNSLVENFSDYFCSKIQRLREQLDTSTVSYAEQSDDQTTPSLESFEPASEAEVLKIISGSAAKSCGLDPIPSTLLKKHLHVLLPVVTQIVNLSLASGDFATSLKVAQCTCFPTH